MRYFGMILCGVAIATPSAMASAQAAQVSDWPIAAGSRVRIVSPILGSERQTGTVVMATPDSLIFRRAKQSTTTAISTPNIVKLEVAQGTHRHVAKGALIGFGVGAVVGGILGYATHSSGCKSSGGCIAIDFGPGGDAALAGGILGVLGLVVGGIAGTYQTDTWVPVAVPPR